MLAQYHATIPYVYRYRIGTTAASSTTANASSNDTAPTPKPTPKGLTLLLSDKSTTYLVAAQLALSQFPAMLLPSAVGWIVGMAWRAELLPGLSPSATGFRVPAWIVGERERRSGAVNGSAAERERYEDLRRRLEGEAAASSSGLEAGPGRRRNVGDGEEGGRQDNGGLMERLRGAW